MLPKTLSSRLLPLAILASCVALAACGDTGELMGRAVGGPGDDDPGAEDGLGDQPAGPTCTEKPEGRTYAGFDGKPLEADRINENIGLNRARVKPFEVLGAEYTRALGKAPAGLAKAESAYEEVAPRWSVEPQATGVGLATLFNVAFEGCLEWAKTAPEAKAAPDATSAQAVCSGLMKRAWIRTPAPAEVDGCVELATTKLATENDVARKWAYTCASVLSSTRFVTY